MSAKSRLAKGLQRIVVACTCVAVPVVPMAVAENLYGHQGGVLAAIGMLAIAGLASIFVLAWDIGK